MPGSNVQRENNNSNTQRETNRNVGSHPLNDNIQNFVSHQRRFPTKPPNALASVIARSATNKNQAKNSSSDEGEKKDDVKDVPLPNRHGYSMQVNEYYPDLRNRSMESSILCVTLREIYQPKEKRHHRVWIPLPLCGKLLEILEKTATSDPDRSLNSQKSNSTKEYNVDLLQPVLLHDNEVDKDIEIEKVDNCVRLRSYMSAPLKSKYVEGDVIEMIVLYPELMSRLIRFLKDTVIRYMPLMEHRFPSLYSYSGERRFYFDCRSSRWGVRLQVSQVTDRHRNTIGVPLDTLIQFRDQINSVLDKLNVLAIDSNDEPRYYSAVPKKRNRKSNVSRRSRHSGGNARAKKTEKSGDDVSEVMTKPESLVPSMPVVEVH